MKQSFALSLTCLALTLTASFALTQEPARRIENHLGGEAQRRPLVSQSDFVEIPGVRQLSSRMIVRPFTRKALRRDGLNRDQISKRIAAAHQLLAHYKVLRHVSSTDDSIIEVPAGITELEIATRLLESGLFEYAEPDWLLSPIQSQNQAYPSSQTKATQFERSSTAVGPSVTVPPRFPDLPASISDPTGTKVNGLPLTPNDPMFSAQYHHQVDKLNSPGAWGLWGVPMGATGGPHISIGVCDTGIRTTHEDLALHRLEAYNAVDKLWESEGGAIGPINPHGTKTTGTAAANGNNGIGVSGVGWNFSHRMLRVSNLTTGNAFLADLQHAARTAIENGDRIANVSYFGASSPSNTGTATYIKSMGGLMIWGAGNSSANYSSTDRDDDDLIVVGATDQNDLLASFSSYGTFVDLVAPGVDILTTDGVGDSAYTAVDGTSYSSPMTTGVCAMIWSARPNLSPNDVERILKASADDLGAPGLDIFFGYGRINLDRAMGSSWSTVPTAEFTKVTANGLSPLAVSFRDLSVGIPTSWLWDFGDGSTSTEQNPVHTFTNSGAYSVALTVRNFLGMHTVTAVDEVLVDIIPPVADFSASVTGGLSPLPVDFADTSTGGLPTAWLWDFGDGTTSTLQNPSHTYLTNGFYTVSMTATNAYGSDTQTLLDYVAVDFIPPVAGFSATPLTGASPLLVNFTDESSAGVTTSWLWNFGDGQISNAQNPSHTYTIAGTYSVSLTATNAYGSDKLVQFSYIEILPGPTILANFVGTPTSGTAPLQVDFTDLSVGNIISWDWNFGDGGTSTLQNPTHIFTSPNEYDIALTVTNAQGKDSCLELGAYITVQ